MGRDAELPSVGSDRANSHQLHDDDTKGLQLEPGIRRGPHPSTTTSTATPSLGNFELTNQDEGDLALNDAEADKHGPLTKEALEKERKKASFDSRHPRRPDCAYAIGVLSRHSATPGTVHLEAAKDLVK